MGYNNDWIYENKFFRSIMIFIGFLYWYAFIMLMLVAFIGIISFCFGSTWIQRMFQEHIEICTFVTSIIVFITIVLIFSIKSNYKKWKLTDEDKEDLSHFHFGKMTRKQKKLMARSIRLSSKLVFFRLSRMNLSEAIKDYECNDFYLKEQSSNDIKILLKAIPNMEYSQKEDTHTLMDWEILLSEERIKRLKDKKQEKFNYDEINCNDMSQFIDSCRPELTNGSFLVKINYANLSKQEVDAFVSNPVHVFYFKAKSNSPVIFIVFDFSGTIKIEVAVNLKKIYTPLETWVKTNEETVTLYLFERTTRNIAAMRSLKPKYLEALKEELFRQERYSAEDIDKEIYSIRSRFSIDDMIKYASAHEIK